MKTETAPLDTKSPYEIATAARLDPRNDFDILTDVMDEKVPEVFELYQRLGLFDAKDGDTFAPQTVMEFMREAMSTGAQIESKHPGLIQKVIKEDFPEQLAKVQADRR